MADDTKQAIDATADAAKATTEAAAETVKETASTGAKASKRVTDAAGKTASKTTRKAKAQRRARRTQPKAKTAPAQERTEQMNTTTNFFAPFGAIPATPFQSLFADAGERGQEAVRRSQKATEELAELTRANVEALVDAGRIAAEGVRSIGQDAVESSRESVEQTAEAVRSLAEAKSPTEFVQLQTELARASFDRFVGESSRLTESMVKLAGEAFQPISTRASLNAERFNQFVA